MTKRAMALGILLSAALSGSVAAQQAPTLGASASNIKRTPLQTFDVPGTSFQTVIGIAEIVPNVNIGRHTHPGPESGYMLEGDLTLIVEGQADKLVKTAESYQVPPGAIHDARTGDMGAKVLATYVVDKSKPLATPAQ